MSSPVAVRGSVPMKNFSRPVPQEFRSTVLVNNIHCASCVTHVRDVLFTLNPQPYTVDSSIVSHQVSVTHSPDVSLRAITSQLQHAGFELFSAVTVDSQGKKMDEVNMQRDSFEGWFETARDRLSIGSQGSSRTKHRLKPSRSFSIELISWEKKKRHIDNCAACQAERQAQSPKSKKVSRHLSRDSNEPFLEKVSLDHRQDASSASRTRDSLFENSPTIVNSPLSQTIDSPKTLSSWNDSRLASQVKISTPPPVVTDDSVSTYCAIFSVGGMTCSSCTNSVSDGVKQLSFVESINVNLLANSACVTYTGHKDRVTEIQEQIEGIGFECTVQDVSLAEPTMPGARPRGETKQTIPVTRRAVLAIEGMTCASCTNAVSDSLKSLSWVDSVDVNLLTNSANVVFAGPTEKAQELCGMIEDLGYECSIQECYPLNSQSSTLVGGDDGYIAHLAIGGMTCAACSQAITTGLSELDYVKHVDVNLMTNSASVSFQGIEKIDAIVKAVDELGYACAIDRIEHHSSSVDDEAEFSNRTISLQVDGMFCDHCPPAVLVAVKSMSNGAIQIQTEPTLSAPAITIKYTPHPPHFTIRDIVKVIEAANKAFSVSVYHPLTIEDRSRSMQLQERRRLLMRLLLCVIIAIPTLLIGVVWMSLVPSSNRIRMYFEERMWAGKVTRTDWALLILATPVYFFAADVFHTRAIKEIKALWRPGSKVPILRRFYRFGSMNLLLSAGTSVAYFSSIALIISESLQHNDGDHGTSVTYFDSVIFLTMFILAGRFLEAFSKAKTGDAVASLGNLRPSETLLLGPDRSASSRASELSSSKSDEVQVARSVKVDLLEIGDIVRIPNGASPPFDGLIVSGDSSFDESSLTGESRPVPKLAGDELFAGTLNCGKPVDMRITGLSGSSMLDQIVNVVREGQTKKAPVERVADSITGYFVPVITAIAIVDFAIWIGLGEGGLLPDRFLNGATGGWPFWSLQFAIAVFVIACPCGIGLAAPTALFVGSGLAANNGILVKGGGEAFQEASSLDAIVFDKTGTLTEGSNPVVTAHETFVTHDSAKEKIVWALATSLEESSSHPIAAAIKTFCSTKPRAIINSASIDEQPGKGLQGSFSVVHPDTEIVQEYEAAIGSEKLMNSLSVTRNIFTNNLLTKWQASGASLALLAVRRIDPSKPKGSFTLAAAFATTTQIRPAAAPTIAALQKAGLGVYIITGDNAATAQSIGARLGVHRDNIIADVLPTEKAEQIRRLQQTAPKRGCSTKPGTLSVLEDSTIPQPSNEPYPISKPSKNSHRAIIAMVGDGINDAPALAASDVSISIGSGTSVAISASKFVLVGSDLSAILTLVQLSRTVFRRVKINFAWALVYNVVLIPIAAGVLMPVGERGVRLSPVWASAAMAASSVSVVLSSLALRWRVPVIGWRKEKLSV